MGLDGRVPASDTSAVMSAASTLLGAGDPPPVRVHRPTGRSPFLLVSDHAGHVIPSALGTLGLPEGERLRHIAWDIGIEQVGLRLSELLDATFIAQTYSRLVIDCNRAPGHPQSIATRSERTEIRGNVGLSAQQSGQREHEIFHPYHACIAAELEARKADGRDTVLVLLHSFTPVYMDVPRRWHAGVLYHPRDTRLPHVMLELLRSEPGLEVGDNEPYAVTDTSDYSIHVHGLARGLLHVELEIRQDLIDSERGAQAWAERLAGHCRRGALALRSGLPVRQP
jgi:predicted N-formylglutamate amidohydrolase